MPNTPPDSTADSPEWLDSLIDTCLHPERNGLLVKESIAEGANFEHIIKRELKAAITAKLAEARIEELRLLDITNKEKYMTTHDHLASRGKLDMYVRERIAALAAPPSPRRKPTMSKHLVFYGTSLVKHDALMLDVSGWMYWSKRLKFWEWRKKHTMGRPVLVRRKHYEF